MSYINSVLTISSPSGQTLTDFQAAAKNAGSSSLPPTVQGGAFGSPPAAASSTTGGSASSTPKGAGNMIRGDLRTASVAGILGLVFACYLS
jgi:hypothetical protein